MPYACLFICTGRASVHVCSRSEALAHDRETDDVDRGRQGSVFECKVLRYESEFHACLMMWMKVTRCKACLCSPIRMKVIRCKGMFMFTYSDDSRSMQGLFMFTNVLFLNMLRSASTSRNMDSLESFISADAERSTLSGAYTDCLHVCMYVIAYMYVYIMCIHLYVIICDWYIQIYVYASYVQIYVYASYVYMYVYASYVYMYVCMWEYMHIYTHTIHVYIYTHTYTYT